MCPGVFRDIPWNCPGVSEARRISLVVSIVFPLGRMLFPYVGVEFGVLQFSALEAVVSTTIGFGIYTAFFG